MKGESNAICSLSNGLLHRAKRRLSLEPPEDFSGKC